jgi:di/tricarboxylate transporter
MSTEILIVLVILVVAIALFIRERPRLDIVAMLVLISLLATGIITTPQALAGFSSTSVITVAALFVVGGAIFQTGLTTSLANQILRISGTGEARLLLVLMIAVAVLSAFMSSTAVIALMLPTVVNIARSTKINNSRLLIPLAFSTLLGSKTTLISTPPNMIASEVLEGGGYAPFQFFDFTPVGLIVLAAGILYMMTIGRKLLPDRPTENPVQPGVTPGELFSLYRLPDNLFRLRIQETSPLVNQTLADSRLRKEFNVNIVEIIRRDNGNNGNTPIPIPLLPGQRQDYVTFHPESDFVFRADDVLLVQANGDDAGKAAGYWKLAMMANEPVVEGDLITNEVGIAEVLLRPRSKLVGKSLSEIRFGSNYHLTVLDIRRTGLKESPDLKSAPLKLGDVLLVQGEWRHIFALKNLRGDFIVMGEPEAIQSGAYTRKNKAPIALFILVAMIFVLALNITDIALGTLIAAMAMVLTGCLTMDEAYESINWKSIILIAGMMPMGTAMVEVGLVDMIANGLINTLGQFGPSVVLLGLLLTTTALGMVISNTATATLIAPLALVTAESMGIQPQAYLMGVAIASSMAFATPIASPVNMLVMGPGNYRFMDYTKIGVPLILVVTLVTLLVLPIFFPY